MQLKQDKMGKNFSLIEKKVIMVDKLIPTDFVKIEILIPTEHKFIYGKYVPIKFREGIQYLPSKYQKIKIPLTVPV